MRLFGMINATRVLGDLRPSRRGPWSSWWGSAQVTWSLHGDPNDEEQDHGEDHQEDAGRQGGGEGEA
jgi:hypothetical protein